VRMKGGEERRFEVQTEGMGKEHGKEKGMK
jgi:hypothetical protein